MCQLRVRIVMPDQSEELLDEVTNVQVEGNDITLSCLFEPPRVLSGFEVKNIDCLHNRVLLAPCAIG